MIMGSDEALERVLPLLRGRWTKELRFEKTAKELGVARVEEVLRSVKGVQRLVLDRVECSAESLMGKSMAGLRSLELHTNLKTSPLEDDQVPFSLQHLSLHASHANDLSFLSALLTSPHLTSVGFVWGRCTSFDVSTTSALIGIAPQLEHLHLDLLEIAEPRPPAELAMLLARCTSLRSLTIKGLEIESLLPILSSLAPPTRLVLLQLHFPLFYNLGAAELARTFWEAMRLPALQALKRWRMENLKQMRLDERRVRSVSLV